MVLERAYTYALGSPDPSTQNGALLVRNNLVLGVGCNDVPVGVKLTDERLERPLKYDVIEHAERNAIYAAARAGHETKYSTLYCPWAACTDCARAIIQAGVWKLVRHKDATEHGAGGNWDGSISIADQMLQEAGVMVVDVEGKITRDGFTIRHAGEEWNP
jgi:dCMP deaminase